jgi:hypothetical protein
MSAAGAAWIDSLPAPLHRHARLLRALLRAVEDDAACSGAS